MTDDFFRHQGKSRFFPSYPWRYHQTLGNYEPKVSVMPLILRKRYIVQALLYKRPIFGLQSALQSDWLLEIANSYSNLWHSCNQPQEQNANMQTWKHVAMKHQSSKHANKQASLETGKTVKSPVSMLSKIPIVCTLYVCKLCKNPKNAKCPKVLLRSFTQHTQHLDHYIWHKIINLSGIYD